MEFNDKQWKSNEHAFFLKKYIARSIQTHFFKNGKKWKTHKYKIPGTPGGVV